MARRPRPRGHPHAARPRLELVPVEVLRPHESLDAKLLAEVRDAIARDGVMRDPILVERSHHVILNGHHRYAALRELGCRRVPAYVIDYFDSRIEVGLWPGAVVDRVTKREVIDRGVRGDLFPPKTTRHVVRFRLKEIAVPLSELR